MGVGLPSGRAASGEVEIPPSFGLRFGDVFFFKTCLGKRMKAPHRKKRFIEVF